MGYDLQHTKGISEEPFKRRSIGRAVLGELGSVLHSLFIGQNGGLGRGLLLAGSVMALSAGGLFYGHNHNVEIDTLAQRSSNGRTVRYVQRRSTLTETYHREVLENGRVIERSHPLLPVDLRRGLEDLSRKQ